jgi:biotin carboxyl carrier protein
MKYITTIENQEYEIEILDENHLLVNGVAYRIDFTAIADQPVYSMLVDDASYEAYVYPTDGTWQVLLTGRSYQARVEDEREHLLREASGEASLDSVDFHLKAPMPGLLVAVQVNEGQEVYAGDVLVILESMKMQNELKSPRTGKVTRLRVKVGDNVEQNETLLSVV